MRKIMCFGGNREKPNLSPSKEEPFTEKGRIGNKMGLEVLMRDGILGN